MANQNKHCQGCVYLRTAQKLAARCIKKGDNPAPEAAKVIGWCKQNNAKTLPNQPQK